METKLDVLIVRDPREAQQKCSLTPLRGMSGVRFVNWKPGLEIDVNERVLLDPEGGDFSAEDRGAPLLVLDCAWKHLAALNRSLRGEPRRRRLPPLVTAYPRKSRVFADPASGLASIEALYAAVAWLDRPRPELLAAYHWRAQFLELNPSLPR